MKLARVVPMTLLAMSIAAQTPAPASIRGVVVKWGTSEPIAQTIVELRNPASTNGVPLFSTATRPNGEYTFPQVPPGLYRIVATRKGFVPGEYGRQRISGAGVIVTLAAGQTLENAQIEMTPGASVSGRVTYPNGDPMPVALVQALKLVYRNGKPELVPQQSTYTDDLGQYRLFWLAPGSYYVSTANAQNYTTPELLINPGGNSAYSWSGVFGQTRPTARIEREYGTAEGQTYITTYYPGSTSWENASLLDLRPGDDATNINITLAAGAQRRIRGVVVEGNQPVQQTIVVSLRQLDANLPVNARVLQFFPDNGRFQFVVTQPGTYELTTTVGMLSGRAVATVRDRDTDVSISLFPATNLTGRVIFDGPATANPQQGSGTTVVLRTPNGQQLTSPINPNGAFSFQNLAVSTYRVELAMAGLPDAYLKSVRLTDRDLPEGELQVDGFPIDELQIVAIRSGGSIEGRVISDRQQPVTNATVAVLPEGMPAYRSDRYRSATVDATGAFQFRGLPAGQYNVYAWIDVDSGAWFNPAFLRNYDSYRRSFPVADGQKQTVEIVAAPVTP